MKLRELIRSLDISIAGSGDFVVRGVTSDSRKIQDDFVFVAIHGNKLDGSAFIEEAVKNGAKAIVFQDQEALNNSDGVVFINVRDSRFALAKLAAEFYGYPSRKMKVIGVTGTNGKTTITYLIEHILKEAGYKTGVIGTINYRYDDKVIVAKNTTPGPEDTQSLLAEMFEADVRYVAMEVSSHALDQDRVNGVDFHAAIFTNLTQDHLDYHKDMEAYFMAKSLLFRNLNSEALAIINKDDSYAQRLMNLTNADVITYSLRHPADIAVTKIKLGLEGSSFLINYKGLRLEINSKLIGKYNVYNILAAVSFAFHERIDPQKIKEAVESFNCVPGRLEQIDLGQVFKVFVDYAHTDDALRNVISSLKEVEHNRIIVVFGCGGDRDKIKRPKMGYIASELADEVIVTADNPRSEDVEDIIEDIKRGIKKDNYRVIPDRHIAIKEALKIAKANDIVLIAGKGHENYQVFKDKTIDFDDRLEAKICLASMIS